MGFFYSKKLRKMSNSINFKHQIKCVTNFEDLISYSYVGEINAVCWKRELIGDFSEIVNLLANSENIKEIYEEELLQLQLSEHGQLARDIILNDLKQLKTIGAAPVLNVINNYDRDDALPFFSTDVYSFHIDRSPIPTHTFLCTYFGESSDILPNSQAIQKILIPEVRDKLKKLYQGSEDGFEGFLSDYFFDLHYQATPNAQLINLGQGHLWKLAVDHPEIQVPPCIHRAPKEKNGESRLLLIC